MPIRRLPALCIHSPSRRYYIRIQRKVIYLGPLDGPDAEAHAEAERLRILTEWQLTGLLPGMTTSQGITINQLLAAYWVGKAETYYRDQEGNPTTEQDALKLVFKPLRRLYGSTGANDFGPLALQAFRRVLMTGDWMNTRELAFLNSLGRKPGRCRKMINRDIDRVRRIFRWGVEQQLIRPDVYTALKAVEGLRRGRSEARETEEVPPAHEPSIEAVLPLVTIPVRAMIQLQLLTGARPGEICRLRPCDIDRTGEVLSQLLGQTLTLNKVWAYIPKQHKTAHHGHTRVIPIGPRAQEILTSFLDRAPEAFCFSPADAEAARDAQRSAARKTPMTPSQRARKPKANPQRNPGLVYSTSAYAGAVGRALVRANRQARMNDPTLRTDPFLHWHPHQLRHNAATRLEREFGWEVARIVCGHRSVSVTRIYVAENLEKAFQAIEQSG